MSKQDIAESLVVAVVIAFAGGAVLSPPDPETQFRYTVLLLPVGLIVAYTFVWRGDWRDS